MKKFYSCFAIAGVLSLVGCGGDSSSSSGAEENIDNIEISSIAEESSSDKANDSFSSATATSSSSVKDSSAAVSSSTDVEQDSSNVPDTGSISSSSGSTESKDSLENDESVGWSWDVPKEQRLNKNIKYGTFIDGRDFKTYKYVTIGTGSGAQLWMAENLNYDEGICWSRNEEYCKVTGALYTWRMAIDSAALAQNGTKCGMGLACDMPEKIKGICPDGWHLPSKKEWEALYKSVGGKETAGKILKATSGWNNNGNGTDEYGFSALPAGSAMNIPGIGLAFGVVGDRTDFWTSTPYNIGSNTEAYAARFISERDNGILDYLTKTELFSVRCVTDAATFSKTPVPVQTKEWSWEDSKEDYFNKSINYGSLTDERDGKKYRTVAIGEGTSKQIWMAENLNYYDDVQMPILQTKSWCFDNEEKNCELAGRLYGWAAAIDSAAFANSDKPITCGYGIARCGLPHPLKGICPEGWHLPSLYDWQKLFHNTNTGGERNDAINLKSATGWYKNGNGSDIFGFSILPVGYYAQDRFLEAGRYSHFWSTYEFVDNSGDTQIFTYQYEYDVSSSLSKVNGGATVRCIKNPEGEAAWDIWSWDVPKESRMNSDINYGTLKDSRDGKTYKTVIIGEGENAQTWMAENLNYDDGSTLFQIGSRCPESNDSYCDIGGRLYTWGIAIDSIGFANDAEYPQKCGMLSGCALPDTVQGICPNGWHIPSQTEVELLLANAGCTEKNNCLSLKSKTGWSERDAYVNGTDDYGFSVLPVTTGMFTDFWTATQKLGMNNNSDAIALLFYNRAGTLVTNRDKSDKKAIRCIKNK